MAGRWLGYAALYLTMYLIGRLEQLGSTGLAVYWPAAGVSTYWALTARNRSETIYGALLAGVLSLVGAVATGHGWAAGMLFAIAHTVGPLAARAVNARLTRSGSLLGSNIGDDGSVASARMQTVGDVTRLLASAAAAAVASGLVGMLAVAVRGTPITWMEMLAWLVRYSTAIVVVTGPALALRRWHRVVTRPRPVEVVVLATLTAGTLWVVFGPGQALPLSYLMLAVLAWVGFRMPVPWAALWGHLVALSTLVLTLLGAGGAIGAVADPAQRALVLQAYMLLATSLPMLLATAAYERRAHFRDVRVARDRAEQLFTDAPHGLLTLRPDGTILRANDRFGVMVRRSPERLAGLRLDQLSRFGDDLRRHLTRVVDLRGEQQTDDWALDAPDGGTLPVSISSRAVFEYDGVPTVLMHVIDISDQRRFEAQLAHMAEHDALTGLANRRQFDHALQLHLDRCEQFGPHGALLVLDVDHFKEVNDRLGHAVGDQLLASIAAILRRSFRRTDLVARLGGDEFAVLLPDADAQTAEAKAAAVVKLVPDAIAAIDGASPRVTASVGVTTFAGAATRGSDPADLADMLMYDAKDAGRNGYAMLSEIDPDQPLTGARMAWKPRLQRAIDEGLFELHLQPLLDLQSDRIKGAEVLVRLADDHELVPPGRFIYIAERTGLITELDAWVARHAIALLPVIREYNPGFTLGFNVSGSSIGNALVEQAIAEAIADIGGVQPGELVVEMTETAAIQDITQAREFAERAAAMNIEFALDDFGSGYGSFRYLKHMAFEWVKIDGDFVKNAPQSAKDRAIIRSMVTVARDLGKRTVAEWVSSKEALRLVRELGVDVAQGYLIGEPVPIDEFIARHLDGALKH
ncbi:bifunctional diguanylate cyclase/phosphodiesterase [Cumulibacter manganitolerans]|uniref:bifunctional diguanylate cyclase/phosphodiesterase n=1 Tax=Cumulibacter manganitolerans TaxID=1884992 RepID=UPI001294EB15|nr:EAL domain-containing protein [Cumulibacter manganitolerans]